MALQNEATRALVRFGQSERIHLEKIRDNFKEKGTFGLRWDSTVSVDERRAWWYLYLFTFRKSDKEEVIKEIKKYIKLYRNIENIQSLTFEQIENMEEDVKQTFKEAKSELRSTDSRTVYKMCQTFLSSKIDKDIEKIKNELGAQQYKKLHNNFKKMVVEESENWKKEYQAEIDLLKEANKKQAEEHAKAQEESRKEVNEAQSRLKMMEQALLMVMTHLAKKDDDFAMDVQKMFIK